MPSGRATRESDSASSRIGAYRPDSSRHQFFSSSQSCSLRPPGDAELVVPSLMWLCSYHIPLTWGDHSTGWLRPAYSIVDARHYSISNGHSSVHTWLARLRSRRNLSLYVYPSAVDQAIVQKRGNLPPMRRAPPNTGPFLAGHSRDSADIVFLS